MFKSGAGYSLIDNGGVNVDCPLCLGEGVIDKPEVGLAKLEAQREEKKELDDALQYVRDKKIKKSKK